MDEILIDEKIYISSKRAAKLTGYAKDYIGQLCREGRVPARLVGRSWYVLESAIHDHRFKPIEAEKEKPEEKKIKDRIVHKTWEAPRYETSHSTPLPSINRLDDSIAEVKNAQIDEAGSQYLEDSWRSWFEHLAEKEISVPQETKEIQEENEESKEIPAEREEPISVPIRAIHELPPEDLLPHRANYEPIDHAVVPKAPTASDSGGRKGVWAGQLLQTIGVLVALVTAALALIGSGYLDEYIASVSQAEVISGIKSFNK